jgi:hypothetical protein
VSWDQLGDIGFYGSTVVTVLFALLYAIFAPWWKTRTGRNIMAVMGSIAVTFAYFTGVIWLGHVPVGFLPMRAFLFIAIGLTIGWRTVIFIRFHIIPSLRTGREHKNELEDAR